MSLINVLRKRTTLVAFTLATMASSASAAVLVSEDFTGATIYAGQEVNLANNPANTADDNLNKWMALGTWSIQSGGICSSPCDGSFAQHLPPTTDNTNLIYYAIDASSLAAGTNLSLSLDFIASNRAGTLYLAGMVNGLHKLDPFAPWFDGETVPPEVLDAILLDTLTLPMGASWDSATLNVTLGQSFDALVIGVAMGGTGGSRAIDNVLLQSVPEPGALALLGLGAVALGYAGRRRKA